MNSNDIFIRTNKPLVEHFGNVVNVNLSETENASKNQRGGAYNDNIVNISLSTTQPTNKNFKSKQSGGKSDTSEYFNRIAKQIVNDVSHNHNKTGGFNVHTTPSTSADSDFFLTSETINDINNVSQSGGAKKTFNFDSLKNHIKRAVELSDLSGGSSDDNEEDDDDEEDLFDDEDDEDDEEDEGEENDEIIKAMNKAKGDDDSDSVKLAIIEAGPPFPAKPVIPPASVGRKDYVRKVSRSVGSEHSKKSKGSKRSKRSKGSKRSKRSNKQKNQMYAPDSESLSLSLDQESTEYEYSDSVSTPQLMAYRNINKHNTITGSRYNR